MESYKVEDGTIDFSPEMHVEVMLQTEAAWNGAGYASLAVQSPCVRILRVSMNPDVISSWYFHDVLLSGFVLSGEIQLETLDGQYARFSAGQAIAETVGMIHRARTFERGVELIVFCISSAEQSLTSAVLPGCMESEMSWSDKPWQ